MYFVCINKCQESVQEFDLLRINHTQLTDHVW